MVFKASKTSNKKRICMCDYIDGPFSDSAQSSKNLLYLHKLCMKPENTEKQSSGGCSQPGPEVIKLFSCSAQLSMIF